jgi:hypothetical protein
MKLNISKEKLDALIKEEAMKLKAKHLQEGKANNKVQLLENKLAEIEQKMREVYAGQELDEETAAVLGITQEQDIEEIFGLGKFEKAKKAYQQSKTVELNQMTQAYKASAPEYVAISTNLVKALRQDSAAIAQQYGIEGSDVAVLYKDLLQVVQPMDYATFKRQSAQGGASFRDVASGANAGQGGDFGV